MAGKFEAAPAETQFRAPSVGFDVPLKAPPRRAAGVADIRPWSGDA